MNAFKAYNAGSERILSPRLVVIDAAIEQIKLRKILKEGLGSHARNGIWIINFQGAPVARSGTEFDLIYLDEEHRVLHAIEISQEKDFEPFTGHAASVLILPLKTVARSRTFTGDRITIEAPEDQSAEPQPASSPKPATQAPPPSAKRVNIPSHSGEDVRPAAAPVSGRLIRSGRIARSGVIAPPADVPEAPQSAGIGQQMPAGKVVRINGGSAPSHQPIQASTESEPAPRVSAAAPSADNVVGAKRTIAPIPNDFVPRVPEPTAPRAEAPIESKREIAATPCEQAPVTPVSAPTPAPARVFAEARSSLPVKVAPLEPTQPRLPQKAQVGSEPPARSEAERSSVKRHNQKRVSPFGPELEDAGDGLEKLSKKILSWLHPEKKVEPPKRRAPRIDAPPLVAYYFAGGPSTPHEIKNISSIGFYMVTDQRWILGTVIRVTIQHVESHGTASAEGITVYARVVRWGDDGGGFEFVIPAHKEREFAS